MSRRDVRAAQSVGPCRTKSLRCARCSRAVTMVSRRRIFPAGRRRQRQSSLPEEEKKERPQRTLPGGCEKQRRRCSIARVQQRHWARIQRAENRTTAARSETFRAATAYAVTFFPSFYSSTAVSNPPPTTTTLPSSPSPTALLSLHLSLPRGDARTLSPLS